MGTERCDKKVLHPAIRIQSPSEVVFIEHHRTNTHHRILAEVVVGPTCNCIQLHQVLKIGDLSLNPFLKYKEIDYVTMITK